MKIFTFAILFILLHANTNTRPQIRQLLDNTGSESDPSTNADCIKASNIIDCNYNNYKTMRTEVCYSSAESKLAQNQRQILFCKQCLRAVEINKLHEADSTKETPRHNMLYLDCSQDQIYRKRGIVFSPETTKRVQAAIDPFDLNIMVGVTIPTSLDYSNYNGINCLTSVKNQGECGSCWAFAATGTYQGILRKYGFNYELSPQASLQCTSSYATNKRVSDCNGGNIPDALNFYAKVGGVLWSSFPYTSGNYGSRAGYPHTKGICTQNNRIYLGTGKVLSYSGLTVTQIKSLLVFYGPLSVGVYSDTGFLNYGGRAVYSSCPVNSSSYINHAVLLYGWDSRGNWLIKNSWGTGWGNEGKMLLSSLYDCGLSSMVGIISIAKPNSNPQVVMDPGYKQSSQFHNLSLMVLLALLSVTFFY